MVIGIFGESCVGKSTVAAELQKSLNAEVYAGKDYLSLDKAELMLERKHGMFDNEKCDMHITETDGNNACARITELLRGRKEV